MASRVSSWLSRPGLLRTLLAHLRLSVRLIREPRVPLLIKAVPLLAVVYVVSPLDFLPDVLPVLGQLDDLGVMLIALETFLRLCPSAAVGFHQAAVAASRRYSAMPPTDDVIDVEWRRHDE
jgi:uncharacterized membrane protein YkvA (DUF1232 family)